MDTFFHDQNALFAQLGLPNSESDINQFITEHSPLPKEIALDEAVFWTPSQAEFIRQSWQEDSEWAEAVDTLNTQLRQ